MPEAVLMIRHVLVWSVTDGSDGDAVLRELAQLEHGIPSIRNFSTGKQLKSDGHSSIGDWRYILMADFETRADLDAYQVHPAHKAIDERVVDKYKDCAVFDYEL